MSIRNLSELWARRSSPGHAALKSLSRDGLLILVGLIGWASVASAQGGPKRAEPPHITNAVIYYDLAPPEIEITGENLKDDLQHPAVSLGGAVAAGGVPLEVLASAVNAVRAQLPANWELTFGAGDHLLVLDSRVADTTPTEFMLTLGATGPQGSQGDPGEPGGPGTNGQDGIDGSSCTASDTQTGASISCTNGTSATVQDGADGLAGADGNDGAPGVQGPAGPNGLACWDLNGDGLGDVSTEDFNGDAAVDVNDCKGDQVINLTVEIPDVPGLVAQDFVTIFPDAAKSTTFIEVAGICTGEGVVVNGPGFEIDVIPGFTQSGLISDNHSGLSTELPLVLEFADDPFTTAGYCADRISLWMTSTDPSDVRSLSIVTKSPSGAEQVRWNMFVLRPTSEQPGFDGRRRFVLEVLGETEPVTGTPLPNPNFLIAIDRMQGSVVMHPSLNVATDKAVEIQGVNFGYPAVEVEDPSANRLVLVYDFVEAGGIFDLSKVTAQEGTEIFGKRDISVYSVDENAVEIRGTRFNYFGCFPMRWEQFTGFRQAASLKERVAIQCDFSEVVR